VEVALKERTEQMSAKKAARRQHWCQSTTSFARDERQREVETVVETEDRGNEMASG
jgi:hypothetical protein